jgi:hypothetical protein
MKGTQEARDFFDGGFRYGAGVNKEDVGVVFRGNRKTAYREFGLPSFALRLIEAASEGLKGERGQAFGGH